MGPAGAKKPRAEITEATERTTALMRELQSRLRGGDSKAGALLKEMEMLQGQHNQAGTGEMREETDEDLENQLHAYFERGADDSPPDASFGRDIRSRVVERVVEKFLHDWGCRPHGDPSQIENEVVDRLVEKVFEYLRLAGRK